MEALDGPKKTKEEKKEYGPYEKYQVERWVETLVEAEEIKQDPEKMKYVSKCMKKKKKAINSIADLRNRYNEMSDEA